MIGTLIETNERVVSALQMYDIVSRTNPTYLQFSKQLSTPQHTQDPTGGIQATVNGMTISPDTWHPSSDGEGTRGETGNVHPDLQDLSFGGLGSEQDSLPPPIQPIPRHDASAEAVWDQHRGSLSDFSDYESEEEREPTSTRLAGPSSRGQSAGRTVDVEDPFADPLS